MNRLISLLLLATAILSCNSQKEDLIINLQSENGYGVFTPARKIIFPNNDSIEYKGVPSEIKEFVVRRISLQQEQFYWEQYKKGKIEKEHFFNVISRYQIDTTKLTNINFDYQVPILIGTNQNEKRVIIIDSDNDEDFSNEVVLEYDYPLSIQDQKKIDNSLPTVLTKFEYNHNGNIINKSINLKPSPYKGKVNYHIDNKKEKKYDLLYSFPEYKKGELVFNKIKYDVFASNRFVNASYSKQKTSIFISNSDKKEPSELDGDIPFQIGDIVNFSGHDYLLEDISLWGDTLKLKYLGKNIHPTGVNEGMFFPKFKAKRLDNSIFTLEQNNDKYILLDYWGTWCNPCIAFIPKLKELNETFKDKDFLLVSVAYDKEIEKVIEFVEKEQMNWEHVFVDRNQKNKNSLVEKLKVNRFPTIILVSPDGRIIARNKPIDEITEILKNAL